MCTYQTEKVALRGSGKARQGWIKVTDATIYFDHPVHFGAGHALMIDVTDPAKGPEARIALELDAASARALAESILRALASVPAGLLVESDETRQDNRSHAIDLVEVGRNAHHESAQSFNSGDTSTERSK
jgi:hypothetical protein